MTANQELPQANLPLPTSRLSWFKPPKIVLGFVAAIIIIAAIVGLAVYQNHKDRHNSSTTPTLSWTNLQKYTVCAKGNAMSFLKPADFNRSGVFGQGMFFSETGGSSSTTLGVLNATCSDTPTITPDYLAKFGQAVSNASDPGRATYISPLYQFVTNLTSSSYSPNFGPIQTFTSQYIKTNAWQMALTFDRAASAASSLPSQKQGVLIWLAGKTTWYQMIMVATSNNWQANQSTWNKIFNSIQIDQ